MADDILGKPGEGRFYLPPSETPDEKPADTSAFEGRIYLPSTDAKPGESIGEQPVEQASLLAGDPPTKDEVKAAKAEQKAADAGDTTTAGVVGDPAAQTTQPDPVAAASALAGDPPLGEPKGNATRDEWEQYARSKGATDADLVGADGKPLGRDELRDKYGTPAA